MVLPSFSFDRVLLPLLLLLQVAFADNHGSVRNNNSEKKCEPVPKPDHRDELLTARWLVHSSDWGVLSTISARTTVGGNGEYDGVPIPFGNVFSVADGDPCDPDTSTGVPHLYATPLDQTAVDVSTHPLVSLTLSEAALPEGVASPWCARGGGTGRGDPENPPCARLVLTGEFVRVDDPDEVARAKAALFARHPGERRWPAGHGFFVARIDVVDLWSLDWFGGASTLNTTAYAATDYGAYARAASKTRRPRLRRADAWTRLTPSARHLAR